MASLDFQFQIKSSGNTIYKSLSLWSREIYCTAIFHIVGMNSHLLHDTPHVKSMLFKLGILILSSHWPNLASVFPFATSLYLHFEPDYLRHFPHHLEDTSHEQHMGKFNGTTPLNQKNSDFLKSSRPHHSKITGALPL